MFWLLEFLKNRFFLYFHFDNNNLGITERIYCDGIMGIVVWVKLVITISDTTLAQKIRTRYRHFNS